MRDWSVNDMTGMPLVLGAAWKDGACAICSVEELHNCPEEKCTADLHEGAFELIRCFLRVVAIAVGEVRRLRCGPRSFQKFCSSEYVRSLHALDEGLHLLGSIHWTN